MDRGSDFG